MDILISNSSDKPIYEQTYLQTKGLIMGGTLQPGEMLPSMHGLAKDLHISVITVHNLRERFPVFLLDDISFQVPCDRIVGFIGENGAGKSTTIKLIQDQLRRDGGSIVAYRRKSI